MPVKLNGKTYYWTAEACRLAGTSKNTFLRWVKEKRFPDTERRDRRGWRLFSEGDLQKLTAEVNKIQISIVGGEHDQ
jgi:hypothetical protein